MTVAYKFSKRQYVEAAVGFGKIRLAHVATFREDDGLEAGRSDPRELTEMAAIRGGEEVISSNDPRFDGMFTFMRGEIEEPMDITIFGAETTNYGDGLLFCASLGITEDLCERMKENFQADAAYEISDIEEFARRIEKHLVETSPPITELQERIAHQIARPQSDPGFQEAILRSLRHQREREQPLSLNHGPVKYRDMSPASSIAAMPGVDPFSKPAAYAWQREYRLVVRPYSADNYLDLQLPNLRELLRIVRST